MENKEVLEKVQSKKAVVGEMEKQNINKAAIISLVAIAVMAITLIIVEGVLGHFSSVYALAFICYMWPAIFYTLQYFFAKRPWPVLFGSVLCGLAGIYYLVRFILFVTGVWI